MEPDLLVIPDALDITAVAHGDVAVVAAQHHLGAFGDDVTVVDTGIDGGLCAAVAHGLDLFDGIGQFHQPAGTGEQMGLEIRTQTETQRIVSSVPSKQVTVPSRAI